MMVLIASSFMLFSFVEKQPKVEQSVAATNVDSKKEILYMSIPLTSDVYYFSNGSESWVTTTMICAYNTDTKSWVSFQLTYPKRHYQCPDGPTISTMEARLGITGDGDGVTDIYPMDNNDSILLEMFENSVWVNNFIKMCNDELQNAKP